MTRRLAFSLYLAAAATAATRAQQASPAPVAVTPAEIAIHKAQGDIAKNPAHYPYYNSLAMAYARRERETLDPAYYDKAEETLKKSFAIQPDIAQTRRPNRVRISHRPRLVTIESLLSRSRSTHFLLSATFSGATLSAAPK
jgi:hypothetical protein